MRRSATGWSTTSPPRRATLVAALLAFSTGAALLAYFLASIALPLGIAAALTVTGSAVAVVWRRLTPRQRSALGMRVWAGVRAGLAATAAYDVTRLALVQLLSLKVSPFAALPIFGQLLVGQSAGSAAGTAAGVAYHLANGLGFGTAYTLLLGRRGVLTGIAFALGLEALMLTFYPGWLDIRAVGEFVSMSMLGHVAYGAVLGWLARRMTGSSRWPVP